MDKDQEISRLKTEIIKLEGLLRVKDNKIAELKKQVSSKPTVVQPPSNVVTLTPSQKLAAAADDDDLKLRCATVEALNELLKMQLNDLISVMGNVQGEIGAVMRNVSNLKSKLP